MPEIVDTSSVPETLRALRILADRIEKEEVPAALTIVLDENVTVVSNGRNQDRTVRQILDDIGGSSSKLSEIYIPARDAKFLADLAEKSAKKLWGFARRCEDWYLERITDLGAVVSSVARLEGRSTADVLGELALVEGIRVNGKQVLAFAQSHGINPDDYLIERWKEDLDEERKRNGEDGKS